MGQRNVRSSSKNIPIDYIHRRKSRLAIQMVYGEPFAYCVPTQLFDPEATEIDIQEHIFCGLQRLGGLREAVHDPRDVSWLDVCEETL